MAGIQTSKITTNAADDLVLDPASGKEVQVKSVDASNPGETPVSVNADGTVKRLDVAALTELTDPDAGDFIVIQAGSVRSDDSAGTTVAGNLYKIDGENLGGGKPADPDPGDIVASPGFLGGDGSAGNPFVITPATVSAPGGSAISAQSITILNQKTFVPVPFTDLTEGADNRFAQPGGVTDATGAYRFNLVYNDQPNTTLGDGQIYNGSIKVGSSSVYFKWDVTQIANLTQFGPTPAPNASPTTVAYAADNKYGTVTATWRDGAETLNASNMVFSVNGGAMDGGTKSVADGDTIAIGFIDSQVLAASDGDTIEGEITGSAYYSKFSMVKDTVPAPFTIQPRTDQSASAETTTGNEPILGINAPTTISAAGSSANQLTNTKVSINGATAVASGTFNPGDSLQGYGTTGATADTTYQATFTVGGVTATWDVTTSASTATIGQPIITSPANGSADLVPDVVLTGSAYDSQGAGAHSATTWEVYEAGSGASVSPSISTTDGESPLTLSGPAPAGLRDKVVMVDSTSPTVVGGETQPTPYTLTTSTITNVAKDEQGIPDPWVYPDNKLSNRDGQQLRAWLDAKGITHVTGFRLKILPTTESEGGLSTEIYEFNINGSELKGSGITPITATGTYYLNADPASWLAGTGTGVVQGESTTLSSVEFTFAPQDVRTGAVYTALRGTRDSVYLFDQNGDPHLLLGMPETGLTFASPNPDLKYFRPGDAVQASSVTALISEYSESYNDASNPTEIKAGEPYTITPNKTYWFTGGPNLTVSREDGAEDEFYITATNDAATLNSAATVVYSGQGPFELPLTTYTYVNVYAGGAGFSTFSTDGTIVKVVSTDLDNNKMGVDGGTWSGSDGTSAGDLWNQSQVWSGQWSGTFFDGYSAEGMFTVDGGSGESALAAANSTITWTPVGVTFSDELVVYAQTSGTAGGSIVANFQDGTTKTVLTENTPSTGGYNPYVLKTGGGTLTSFTQSTGSSATKAFIMSEWRADGKLLIDAGQTGAPVGATDAKTDITGKGEVAATNGAQVTLTNVEGRWVGSGSENKAGKTFYAATVEQDAAPGAPSDPVDTSTYTAITPSATTLTTATLDDTNLNPAKFYYSRVKYGDGSIESDFSEYNEFGTAESFGPPDPGTDYEGGYFAGQINDSGTIYDIIIAPAESGGLTGQYGGKVPVLIEYKTSNSTSVDALGEDYGAPIQIANANAEHPMFNWAHNLSSGPNAGTYDATNQTGTGIGGFNDWYIGAKNEFEILYRNLKPSTDANRTDMGYNPVSVPAGGYYTATDPAQTTDTLFQRNGPEALLESTQPYQPFWTATQKGSTPSEYDTAYNLYTTDGHMYYGAGKSQPYKARCIRRSPA